jgi:pyruvate,orthophosphate dikinase
MGTKYVYAFSEGNASMKDLLGGKGAGLAEMVNIGLPVPQGITVTTQACMDYYKNGEKISGEIKDQIFEYLKKLEDLAGKMFGGNNDPLLVSARSGAKISMPGMMDTILNLGLNPVTVEALAHKTENRRFAYDSYRRFIMMFSDVALNVDRNLFENELEKVKREKGYRYDTELTEDDLVKLCATYKDIYKKRFTPIFRTSPQNNC